MTSTNPSERTVYRTCPLCEATCGLAITVRGDRALRIRGDDDDVFSHGFICPKGPTLAALHEDPNRLRAPLVRKRGGDGFDEVSWDQAFRAVEAGLAPIFEAHGRNAVAAYAGNPNVHGLAGSLYLRPVLKGLGTRNVYSASTVDQMPRHVSSGLMYGSPISMAVPDLDRTHYLLMLGANPYESNGSLCTAPDFPGRLKALRERGGKLVVVDPRRTRTARAADEHLAIQPGTDPLLLLALAHTLFDEQLVALGRLEEHIEGLERVGPLLAPFTPEAVAEHCRIAPDTIRRIARELAAAESAAVYGRIGVHTASFGTLASWGADLVTLLTGNLDRAGGMMFPLAAHARRKTQAGGRGFTTGRWRSRARQHPEVLGELPVATLADEIETPGEDRVRALVTVAGNPVLSAPDSTRLDAALASLDFMVSVDPYLNETTRHADVILPPPSALERSHYDVSFTTLSVRNVANYSPPVFERQGPSEAEILARLALVVTGAGADADPKTIDDLLLDGAIASAVKDTSSRAHGRGADEIRAALGERPPEERLLDVMIRSGAYGDGFGADPDGLSLAKLDAHPHGIDLGPLEPRLPELLATASGQLELVPNGIEEDVARLAETLKSRTDGIVLVGRRDVRSNNSWMHNVPALVSGRNRCTLQIHSDDAAKLELEDGGLAHVSSKVGEIEIPVEITDDILPGVVSIPHGWGHDMAGSALEVARAHAGVNTNRLTDGGVLDPLSGNTALNGIPVSVRPA